MRANSEVAPLLCSPVLRQHVPPRRRFTLPPSQHRPTHPRTRASLALPGDGCMQSLPLPLASFREVFTVNTRTHPLKGERRLTPSNFALDRQLQIVQMYCGGVELDQLTFLPYFEEICGKPIMWTSGGVEFLDPPLRPHH